ncbi:MAG: DUF6889 family protein [Bilophila wadsworthia]
MRPVLRGLCRYEGLKDGTLSLEDVALMNDALTVQEENERRFMAAKKRNVRDGCSRRADTHQTGV